VEILFKKLILRFLIESAMATLTKSTVVSDAGDFFFAAADIQPLALNHILSDRKEVALSRSNLKLRCVDRHTVDSNRGAVELQRRQEHSAVWNTFRYSVRDVTVTSGR